MKRLTEYIYNQSIGVTLTGVLALNETVMSFLMGDPNAKSSPFGHGGKSTPDNQLPIFHRPGRLTDMSPFSRNGHL